MLKGQLAEPGGVAGVMATFKSGSNQQEGGNGMKHVKWFVACLLVSSVLFQARAESDLDFVVNALPATVLLDASGDKFATEDAAGRRISLSEVYTMPNIAAGVGMDYEDFYFDLVGGAGVVINDGFRSFLLQAMLEATYAASDSLSIGPRIGVVYFTGPEWLENDEIEFDEEAGLLVGVSLAMGDKIKYLVSVDIIDVTFDVDDRAGVAEDDEFELTGLAIQFGVRGIF